MTLGRAALEARDLTAARAAIAPLIGADAPRRPTARTCLLMADIETADGAEGAAREWLARAARAPRDKAWIAGGIISDRWAPASPAGALDAFVWRAPEERLSAPGIAPTHPRRLRPRRYRRRRRRPPAADRRRPVAAAAAAPPFAASAPPWPPATAMIAPTPRPTTRARSAATRRPTAFAASLATDASRGACLASSASGTRLPRFGAVLRWAATMRSATVSCAWRRRGGLPVPLGAVTVSAHRRRSGRRRRSSIGKERAEGSQGVSCRRRNRRARVPRGGDAMADAFYYVDDSGQQQGPVAADEITRIIRRGMVRAETLTWTAGMGDWARADVVPVFASALPGRLRRCLRTPRRSDRPGRPADWRVPRLGSVLARRRNDAGNPFRPAGAVGGRVVLQMVRQQGDPAGRPAAAAGKQSRRHLVAFRGLGLVQWIGPTLDAALDLRWGGALSSIFAIVFGWALVRWFCGHAETEDGATKIAFIGGVLPYIGWSLLVGSPSSRLSAGRGRSSISCAGFASGSRARRASPSTAAASPSFGARRLLPVSIFVIPIPWLMKWFSNWMISQFSAEPEAQLERRRGRRSRAASRRRNAF